jgi:hypothetical protein
MVFRANLSPLTSKSMQAGIHAKLKFIARKNFFRSDLGPFGPPANMGANFTGL